MDFARLFSMNARNILFIVTIKGKTVRANYYSVHLLQMSHWDICKISLTEKSLQGESGLVRFPLEKLSLFSPLFSVRRKYGAGYFAVCGRRPELLALDLASIFEKLLDQKTSLPSVFFGIGKKHFKFHLEINHPGKEPSLCVVL